jgi:hypothetical protein
MTTLGFMAGITADRTACGPDSRAFGWRHWRGEAAGVPLWRWRESA